MTVSGIVVNYRTPALTIRAATSLLDDGADEVVIVENGSGDDSAAELGSYAATEPRARLVVSPENLGFGKGVNLGAERAHGDHLFLLNSDAVVERGCTDELRLALERDPSVAAVAPVIVNSSGLTQVDAFGVFPSLRALVLRRNRRPADVDEPDWVSGGAVMVRRDDFDAVGGFDPRFFMYFEDIDLCRRLRARQRRIRRVRSATVVHAHAGSRVSQAAFLQQYFAAQDDYVAAARWSPLRRFALRAGRTPIRLYRRLRAR